jgi:GAF domain-containing protein
MALPLIENGEVIGALDFQNERPGAFDLDDVAAGEAIAEFLVVALRNARLFAANRAAPGS